MKSFTRIELLVVIALILVMGALLGCAFPFDILFHLALGWVLFLWRVLPKVRIDLGNTLVALGCLAGLALGLHLFLRWLHDQVRPGRDGIAYHWQPRWTAMILALVVLMFVAGVSAVGIAHQTTWLLTSPEPLARRTGTIREAAARMHSMNNLKQIGLAVHHYHDDRNNGKLPPGATFDNRGNALHGWQTWLLPYIEEENLFKKIDPNVPWSDPRNAPAFHTPVRVYLQPENKDRTNDDGFAVSHYAANVRVLGGEQPRTFARIPDGLANTILAGEVWANYSPWGRPGNWRDPARGIRTTPDSFGSMRDDRHVVVFLFADGSVRSMSKDISPATLKALATPDGGDDPGDW